MEPNESGALAQLINSTREAAFRKQQLKEGVVRLHEFKERADGLERRADELGSPAAALRVVRTKGLSPEEADDEKVEEVRTRLGEVMEDFLENSDSILQTDLDRLHRNIGLFATGTQKRVLVAWNGFLDGRIPPRNDRLLGVFESIPSTTQNVRAIHALYEGAAELYGDPPTSEQKFDAANLLIDQLRGAVRRLGREADTDDPTSTGGVALPPDVEKFLSHSTDEEGASLDLLTPPVRAWLDENELASSFQIRVREVRSD